MMVGYAVENIKSNERGMVDLESLEKHVTDKRGRLDDHQSQHRRRVRREHPQDLRHHACQRRAGLHGRREHERAWSELRGLAISASTSCT